MRRTDERKRDLRDGHTGGEGMLKLVANRIIFGSNKDEERDDNDGTKHHDYIKNLKPTDTRNAHHLAMVVDGGFWAVRLKDR